MKNNFKRLLSILVVIGVLITCYYCYYSYYINLFNSEHSLLISRTALNNLNLDTELDPIGLGLGIKLSNASVYLLVFATAYSALAYLMYQSLEGLKLMLVIYFSVLVVGFIVLFIAMIANNNSFLYRAGAEIKNFVWSPLFMMLIVLAPYTLLLRKAE